MLFFRKIYCTIYTPLSLKLGDAVLTSPTMFPCSWGIERITCRARSETNEMVWSIGDGCISQTCLFGDDSACIVRSGDRLRVYALSQ
jgi:hypothetical protein